MIYASIIVRLQEECRLVPLCVHGNFIQTSDMEFSLVRPFSKQFGAGGGWTFRRLKTSTPQNLNTQIEETRRETFYFVTDDSMSAQFNLPILARHIHML